MKIRTVKTGGHDVVRVEIDGGNVVMTQARRVHSALYKPHWEDGGQEIMAPNAAERLAQALSDAAAKARDRR